jgi:hypothetical protein
MKCFLKAKSIQTRYKFKKPDHIYCFKITINLIGSHINKKIKCGIMKKEDFLFYSQRKIQ